MKRLVARFATPTLLFASFTLVATAQTVNFDNLSVSLETTNDEVVATIFKNDVPFIRTSLPTVDVGSREVVNGALELKLKSGKVFVFSGAYGKQGFVTIDYRQTGDVLLTNEEPLIWETVGFDSDRSPRVKAFGTAGLKDVDAFAGSYAFLALVDPDSRAGLVGGWITSEKAGGVVRSGKTVDGVPVYIPQLDYGRFQTKGRVLEERFVVGWFDDCRDGLEGYADAIASHYGIMPKADRILGYCTWYAEKHGGACDEKSIRELTRSLVDNFGDFGFQYVQIDSQWQSGASKNGENKDFSRSAPNGPYPSGMKPTADFIKSCGLRAGLWIAPFSGNYDDPYFADKQDLFVRSAIDYPAPGEQNARKYPSIDQKQGAPYETFWGGTCLDMSNPKARDFLRENVRRIVKDWGFDYLKTDALWTGAAVEIKYVNDEYEPDDMGFQLFYDPKTTNIENFRTGLETMRDAAGDAFILGSVASQNMRVLASSYGLVDAMRIGPDNDPSWNGVCAGPIRGTNRYFYNGRVWFNDPDPVYARTSIPLERARVSASWAALTGQLYALGDWVPDYDAERIDLVRKTIPNHLRKTVRPVDLFESELARVWLLTDSASGVRRDVVGFFNWNENEDASFELTPERLGLPLVDEKGAKIEKYVAFDFWGDRFVEPFESLKTTIPKASCALWAIRPVGDKPILLSTSRHITQGVLEVSREIWDEEKGVLTIDADVPKKTPYELRVYNPQKARLERWTAPSDLSGETTFEYRPNAKEGERFTTAR